MIRKDFYLTAPQVARLEEKAENTGLRVSELIRRAIDFFLEEDEKKKHHEDFQKTQ